MNNRGFSLIEVVIVMTIMLLVGVSSSSFYARFLTQNSVDNLSDQIAAQVRKAQLYAELGRFDGPWGVATRSGNLVLFKGTSYAARNAALDEKFTLNPAISINGFTDVVFSQITGKPSSTPTITLSGRGVFKTITINSQGMVDR